MVVIPYPCPNAGLAVEPRNVKIKENPDIIAQIWINIKYG